MQQLRRKKKMQKPIKDELHATRFEKKKLFAGLKDLKSPNKRTEDSFLF